MTDDDDRTQEIRRDGDRYRPADASQGAGGQESGRGGSGNTPPFGSPSAPERTQQLGGYRPQPQAPVQQGQAYRPAPPQPAYTGQSPSQQGYAQPMLPTSRGSSGFPAALVAAVVATLLSVVTAYIRYQENINAVHNDAGSFMGWVNGYLGLLAWPFGDGGDSGDRTTAFIAGLLIVLVVTLVLAMASAMTTRPGNGGFSVFFSGWTATVVAGAIAEPVSAAIWMPSEMMDNYVMNYLTSGIVWGFSYGWIVGLVLFAGHSMRRKPVAR